jgi:L-ascorbate metabolism protein UlaG (beta-lactamase superfamily)
VKIKWLGHSSFLITSSMGTRIITDPFNSQVFNMAYPMINESADLVSISHNHDDHNDYSHIKGKPVVLTKPETKTVKDIQVNGIQSYHDSTKGSQRGGNVIFVFMVDDLNVCHLGDLGYILSNSEITELGKVDILLIPTGGKFTIGPIEATQLIDKIKPSVIIPMHYMNDKCGFLPHGIEDFIKGKNNVLHPEHIEIEFNNNSLPSSTQIYVLKVTL